MISAGVIITDPYFRNQIVEFLQGAGVRIGFALESTAGQARMLESTSPDLLVLDFSQPGMAAVMADLKAMDAPVSVIAAHHLGEPETILTALRLGAREFLWPPLNEKALRDTVRNIESERVARAARQKAATLVGFLSAAGGCGATTLACHLAAELGRLGAGQAGLIDFDLAAGMAGFWFGARSTYSVLDALNSLGRIDTTLWKGLVSAARPNLDVLTAPAAIPLGGLPGIRGFVEVLRYARFEYDWLIADAGAHLTPLSLALLDELDIVYLVTTPEATSLLQTGRVIQTLVQQGYTKAKLRLLVSRAHKDEAVSSEELQTMLGVPVDGIFPSEREGMAEAHASRSLLSPKSEFGKRMTRLVGRLSGKAVEETRAPRFGLFRTRAQEA